MEARSQPLNQDEASKQQSQPDSPVRNQPSTKAAAVASGGRQ